MSLVRLEPGGFYIFGNHKGLRPVRVYVGRIDDAEALDRRVSQPIVHTAITSLREGMPMLGLAPFYASVLIMEPVQKTEPFDLSQLDFAANYRGWRAAFDAGHADIWEVSPSEVYNEALKNLIESNKQIRRPS